MTRNEWIEQAKTKLDTWNEKMDELDARAASLKEDARAEYHRTLADARSHLGTAKQQLAKAQDVGGEAWDQAGKTLQEAWTSEKQVIEKALADLTA